MYVTRLNSGYQAAGLRRGPAGEDQEPDQRSGEPEADCPERPGPGERDEERPGRDPAWERLYTPRKRALLPPLGPM